MSLLEHPNFAATTVPASPDRSTLTEQTFADLRSFIYDHTGIYFQDNKRYLMESRIGKRLGELNLPDYGAYLKHLRKGGMQAELSALVNAITINETFFFRNTPQLEVLESDLLPELIKLREQDGTRRIRIWSAACSTGDEPYTVALMLKEKMLPRYPNVQFEIVGTDINTEVLEVARAGTYGGYAMRNVPQPYRAKYFTREGDRHTLKPEIRTMVTFKHLNLMDRTGMMMMRNIDLILCANVLIYFDTASKQKVVSSFYDSLLPGGHLLVGFSETLFGITQALQPVRFDKTIAYKRA